MISIMLNGREHQISTEVPITKLLERLDIPHVGTAVAINNSIIPPEQHEDYRIRNGDSVEIIRAIGGG